MAIYLEHFCTKTGKPIIANGESIIEKIEHCLAEYFAPNATFKLGVVYPGLTTEEDLKQFTSQGLTLEFAADRRFYFMDERLREKLFDQPHFGAAYGSNLFTPCKSFSERENLRVLVVDAKTGENGGVMPNSDAILHGRRFAIALVGDGDGKIDIRLHTSLGNQESTPFQTRFGIKERRAGLDVDDENQPLVKTWQLGKGTFAPRDLSNIGNGYDLIISSDQLKGRTVGEREREELGERGKIGGRKTGNVVEKYSLPLNSPQSLQRGEPPEVCWEENLPSNFSPQRAALPTPPIPHSPAPLQPGEYIMTMGIGNKTDAYYGITSTGAQFWNSFPQGIKNDVLPLLERRLEELRDIADDPRKVAQDYINSIEARFKHQMQSLMKSEDLIDFDNLDFGDIENQIDEMFSSMNSENNLIYRILKTDLERHYQLLEHPKIIDKLQEYLREQYMDCATGRFIKFDSAMAQTCHDLAANEVCYPKFPDGAELIVYRGPTANSNTVDIYINRHLPNELLDIGTIKMSPQGLKHSLSDCDGDRMAIALASKFPHTAAEIKQKQLPENRYAEIIKPEKQAYIGSFERIALDAMENKIGVVANLCMKGIALENECVSIPDGEAEKFIRDISCAAVEMLKAENQSFGSVKYPNNLRSHIVELAQLCPQSHQEQSQYSIIPQFKIGEILERIGKFYHNVVGALGGELQIEVDRGKSANRSNPEVVNACNTIIKCFDVAPWVEERKWEDVYTKRDINIKGHGAIDMMAKMTNDAFSESAIAARSTQQFQYLFKGVEFTPIQKASAVQIKKIYDSLIHRAIAISREVEQSPGLKIIATNSQGQQIEIVGLAEKKHPNLSDDRKLDITVVANKSPYSKSHNKWIAIAPVFDTEGKPELQSNGQPKTQHLGYVSETCLQQLQGEIKPFNEFRNLEKEIVSGFTTSQVRAAFKQVREYAIAIRENIPDAEKEAFAAAMWQISTASKEDTERVFKKTSAAFAIFGEELVERLDKLQFTEFAVVGTHKPSNEYLGRKWVGEKVECRIEQLPDPTNPEHNKRWLVVENKKLGVFRSESAQLPIGTSFNAEMTSPPSASVLITSTQGNQLKVGQLRKYAFPEREWKGEDGVIIIKIAGNGKAVTPLAFVDDKPLGVVDKESFQLLSERLKTRSIKVDGFQFQGKLESSPATIAHIKVDPETVRYPQVWTREDSLVREKKIKADEKISDEESYLKIPTIDITKTKPIKREEWEKQMLRQAIACLKENPANTGEEMQTATFGDGKYRVIYHEPSEMLRVVDEIGNRGTLYKLRRGEAVQVCKFTEEEKQDFEILTVESSQKFLNAASKNFQRE
ncbi:hypothetical protein [Calothrix sp. UHCC 0171]|uniref:hypothetical protein n=1 Tax=Calothrix sp. UHCC 0171 TaxID=3110245 RepID=UPI002B1F6426|nr:hypothetical protein [Calothrix sp. UHCC 0171]MEA5574571.1 hypothetical protein [Calothrix sp. UHCC 0171]